MKCLTKYGAFWSRKWGARRGDRKILEKQSSFALYLYSEAINSQFYEHLLMITAGINDLRGQAIRRLLCSIMGKGYGDYARLNLKPIQVENLFSTKNPACITDMRK